MPSRLRFAFVLVLFFGVPLLADVTGRWTAGGRRSILASTSGDAVTGGIQGRPREPTYKIVDGTVRGNRIFFFVLHENENDSEVKANGEGPFHNVAQGTFTADEITVSGARENTKIREYRLVLKRITPK